MIAIEFSFNFREKSGSARRAAAAAARAVLAAGEEGEAFKEGDVLLVLQERAVQRRGQFTLVFSRRV
jgi:hypothetical protein